MSSTTDGEFKFAVLPTVSSIRLFRVAPSTAEGDFAFEVIGYELQDAPAYTALSYRWGSGKQRPLFVLNSKWKSIHQNLWYFLYQLRLEKDTGLYWSDGICINQDDVEERSQQVSMMAEIYSKAQAVVIWLGPHPHIGHCLEVLGQAGRPDFLAGESDESRQMARTHAVREILSLEYWRRAWIVQEVALGKNVRLKSLAAEFDYEEFVNLCTKSSELSQYGSQKRRVDSARNLLKLIASYKSSSNGFNLGRWLSELEGSLCMDPRDKIYSLLGLLRFSRQYETIQHSMTVDYSRPVETVFLECAFMLLTSLPNQTDVSVDLDTIKPIYDLMSNSPVGGLLWIQKYSVDPSVSLQHKVWIGYLIHEVISFQLGMAEVNDMLDFHALIKENNHLSIEKNIAQKIAALAVKRQRQSVFDVHKPWPLPSISGTCPGCKESAGYFHISEEELSIQELDALPPRLLLPSSRPKQLVVQILRKALGKERIPGRGSHYVLVPDDDHMTVSLVGDLPFSVVIWVDVTADWDTESCSSHRVPQEAGGDDKVALQDIKLDRWWFVLRRSKLEDEKFKWRVYPVLIPGTICSCSQEWTTQAAQSSGIVSKIQGRFEMALSGMK